MSIFSGLDFLLLVPHLKCPESLQNGVETHIIVHGSEQWIGFKLPMWRCLRKDHQRPPTVHPVSSRRLSTWTNGLEKPSIWVQCDNQLRRWTSPLQEGRPVQAPPTEPNLSTDQVSLTEISRLGPFNPQGSWAFFHPTKTAWASAGFCLVFSSSYKQTALQQKKISRIFLNELGSGNFIYSDDLPWQISAL